MNDFDDFFDTSASDLDHSERSRDQQQRRKSSKKKVKTKRDKKHRHSSKSNKGGDGGDDNDGKEDPPTSSRRSSKKKESTKHHHHHHHRHSKSSSKKKDKKKDGGEGKRTPTLDAVLTTAGLDPIEENDEVSMSDNPYCGDEESSSTANFENEPFLITEAPASSSLDPPPAGPAPGSINNNLNDGGGAIDIGEQEEGADTGDGGLASYGDVLLGRRSAVGDRDETTSSPEVPPPQQQQPGFYRQGANNNLAGDFFYSAIDDGRGWNDPTTQQPTQPVQQPATPTRAKRPEDILAVAMALGSGTPVSREGDNSVDEGGDDDPAGEGSEGEFEEEEEELQQDFPDEEVSDDIDRPFSAHYDIEEVRRDAMGGGEDEEPDRGATFDVSDENLRQAEGTARADNNGAQKDEKLPTNKALAARKQQQQQERETSTSLPADVSAASANGTQDGTFRDFRWGRIVFAIATATIVTFLIFIGVGAAIGRKRRFLRR